LPQYFVRSEKYAKYTCVYYTGLNNLLSSLMGTGNLGNTAAAPDRGMEIVGGGFIELQSYNSRLLIMGC